jgi:heme/copper-type cytochrome/quinol oxidase subunit 3
LNSLNLTVRSLDSLSSSLDLSTSGLCREAYYLIASSATAATATAAAVAAISSATATAASTTLYLGTGFVDIERSPTHLSSVQGGDRFVSFFCIRHFHETESARASGVTIGHDADPVYLPMRLEHLPQLFL